MSTVRKVSAVLAGVLCFVFATGTRASAQAGRVTTAASIATSSAQPVAEKFPHAKHEKLFPQCAGCHAGIPTGVAATSFPDTALCGQCHNNRDQKKVAWAAPVRSASNLKFSHASHSQQAGASQSSCTSCHATPDAKWMNVNRAKPDGCRSCHTHQASAHFAVDNRCATCHVTLAQATGLSLARVAALEKPASHSAADFASNHKAASPLAEAQCAYCHARESCARCHVNASRVTSHYGLAPDARVASIVASKPASYATPASHRASSFVETHGPLADANIESCASCHTRTSCQACHTGQGGANTIDKLQNAERGGAPGVQIKTSTAPWNGLSPAKTTTTVLPVIALGPASQPRSVSGSTNGTGTGNGTEPKKVQVHPVGFARSHGASAASGQLTCEGCHSRSYCAECHAGEGKRRFHVANFAARHAPEAWGRESDCASCHNTEVFCRGCHMQVGLSSKGRSNAGFHSAIPLWLLEHGQAARQGLSTCTSCHTQKDCMQCHSQAGRSINPHGADFDARAMWRANRLVCLRCHFKDPFAKP